MKTNHKLLRTAALLAGAFLFASPLALHADEHMKEHGEHGHSEMAQPGSAAAALETIHMAHAELATQVSSRQLKSVHETTEKLAAAANALPGLSKDLPAEKQKRVDGSVKNLAKALDALHDAADEGDQAGTEKHLKTVDSLIGMISMQYGSGAAPKKSGHDH